jgi:hypothetical protein
MCWRSEARGSTVKTKSAAELAAMTDPIIAFLRGGLDALKEPPKSRRR